MAGPILPGIGEASGQRNEAATRQIAQQIADIQAQYARLDGAAFTGEVTVQTPTNPTDATTKAYVDAAVAAAVPVNGIDNHHLAQMAAKTVKANITSSSADAVDVTLANFVDAAGVKPGRDVEICGQIAGAQQQSGTTYTLVLSDIGKIIEVANAAAITLTIPPNSSVAFPVRTIFNITQTGAGQITITGGTGVTVQQRQSKFKTAGQWAMATIYQQAANVWVLGGDLST